MKKLILFLLLLAGNHCNAQNYACLQNGTPHYFINGNGYLRGIRIDSVKTYPDSTVYYPFHTPRGAYNISPGPPAVLNKDGGSWLGKKVTQLTDGTFIFDNYFTDSIVVIQTQAKAGDSWVFYKDTGSLYYNATVVSTDTMTVLGSVDSIKQILITAQNAAGVVPSDSLNNLKITLSKNSGFVQVFDLYTFPYHKPDSAYHTGLDFFLDKSTNEPGTINGISKAVGPNSFVTVFKLVDFINQNEQQLYAWNTGDIISSETHTGLPIAGGSTREFLQDTITGRSVAGHIATITAAGSLAHYPSLYPGKAICQAGTYNFSDLNFPIIGDGQVPEDSYKPSNYIFYYPDDTDYCVHSPKYLSVRPSITGLGSVAERATFKKDVGRVSYYYQDGEPTYETDDITYYHIGGNSCGTPLFVPENTTAGTEVVSVYPNPATNEVTISSSARIQEVTICDLLGQAVLSKAYNSKQVKVDVANLSKGTYFIKMNGTEVRRFVKE